MKEKLFEYSVLTIIFLVFVLPIGIAVYFQARWIFPLYCVNFGLIFFILIALIHDYYDD